MLIYLGNGEWLNLSHVARVQTQGETAVVTFGISKAHTDALTVQYSGEQAKSVLAACSRLDDVAQRKAQEDYEIRRAALAQHASRTQAPTTLPMNRNAFVESTSGAQGGEGAAGGLLAVTGDESGGDEHGKTPRGPIAAAAQDDAGGAQGAKAANSAGAKPAHKGAGANKAAEPAADLDLDASPTQGADQT